MDKSQKPPPSWGDDELSHFQEVAYRNSWATFANLPELWNLYVAIDKTFHTYVEQLKSGITNQNSAANHLLVLLSHSQLRAKFSLASAGHCSAVFPAGRAALESALYSWYLTTYPHEADKWHEKPTERDARRKWGKKFSFSSITEKLKAVDAGSSKRAKTLHQQAIDFGSHPNPDGLYSNVVINEIPQQRRWIGLNSLHSPGQSFDFAIKFACEVGLVSLELVYLSNPNSAPNLEVKKRHSQLSGQYKRIFNLI